jgi:hypothetical protein
MTQRTTITWLKVTSALVIGTGILLAVAAIPAAASPVRVLTDLAFWPPDGAQRIAAPETRMFCAISGGVTAGWGVMLWLLASRLYPREPALARTMILVSLTTWFAIDSSGSLIAGAHGNAILNLGFWLAFVVPLAAPSSAPPASRQVAAVQP